MSYDCCGAAKLEGEELLNRIARALGITVERLKEKLR